MSVRGIVRLGSGLSLASTLRLGSGTAKFTSDTTYISETSSTIKINIGGTTSATFEADGGILHGSWNVESAVVTSDRRLKTNIVPLQRTLRDVIVPRGEQKAPSDGTTVVPAGGTAGKKTESDGALWLLRQLRPVSYSFRKGVDSKFMRFGFIADELETVVPEIVRRPGDREVSDQKAVVYQDLIALLAGASQSLAAESTSQKKIIEQQAAKMEAMEAMQLKHNEEVKQLMENQVKMMKMMEVSADAPQEEVKKKEQKKTAEKRQTFIKNLLKQLRKKRAKALQGNFTTSV